MERNFYDDEFEDFLKQKADQYALYPSDKSWHVIYTSLHSNRRWYTAAGAFLLITTLFFISLEIASTGYQKAARNIVNDSISSSRSVTSTSAKRRTGPGRSVPVIAANYTKTSGAADNSNDNNKPQSSNTNNTTGNASNDAFPPATPAPAFANPNTNGFRKAPFFFDAADPSPLAGSSMALNNAGNTPAGLNKSAEEKQMKEHQVNWLREGAALRLKSSNKKYYHLQFYISPGASYRRLKTDKNNLKTMSPPTPASGDLVNIDGIVDHQPSFSLEAGTALLYNVSDRFVLKAGVQLNYIKYDIKAYRSPRERTAITLSRAGYSNIHDTITSYSSIRNLGGRYSQELQNQYVQLSLPIGAEIRLLGNNRFQFNISGTLQPSYLLYNNTYLLTSDYGNYIKQPRLVRKWNVNAAIEPYISYKAGGLRWQLGPQFRYQLLSSYTDRYPVREFLMEYGIKIGVSKTLR